MAWRSSGHSNAGLIDNLYNHGLIKSPKVKEAMMKVDRANFCPDATTAYEDSPQPIGHSATISAPHMHANAAESLLPYIHERARILDIGSGSGYLTAVFAELACPETGEPEVQAGEKARVVGLENIPALRDLGESNMGKTPRGRKLLDSSQVQFVVGDGREGWGDEKGWDAIHVGAAASELHQKLVDQLRSPGRLFIPVEDPTSRWGDQHIWVVDKDENGNVKKQQMYGVRYVPLTDAPPDVAKASDAGIL